MRRRNNISEDETFTLSEEEQKKVAEFDNIIQVTNYKKRMYIRELAMQKGFRADKFEDLKSKSGISYAGTNYNLGYTKAVALKEGESIEYAYLCISKWLGEEDKDHCGWVKGEPLEQEYDERGPMCGSSGTRYTCRLCGKEIGEYVFSKC